VTGWARRTLYNIGAIREASNDLTGAWESYKEAISIVEKIGSQTVVEELRSQIASETVNLYKRAVLVLLRKGQQVEAFNLSERTRARSLLDLVGNSDIGSFESADPKLNEEWQKELKRLGTLQRSLREENSKPTASQNPEVIRSLSDQIAAGQFLYEELLNKVKRSNPEYASFREVDTADLTAVQALLDKQTTLVSYFVGIDKVVAFVISSNSFQAVVLPVTDVELKANLTAFAYSFDNLSIQPTAVLRKLHGQLITPLERYLTTPVVGIIPHDVLHYVPFAALFDGQRYLIDKYTLFSLPSASLLRFIAQKRKPAGRDILSISMSQAEGLPILRFADPAARSVADLFGKQALTGAAATESAFRARAPESAILFVAAHGKLNIESPMFSELVMAADQDNDGMLEVHEIYGLKLKKTNLVVLSAYQTQLGNPSRRDDIVSLNRAFIYAGAPTVVASLWSVKEEQTGALMYSFLKHYREGMGKAAALQAAQREVRATSQHPYYWAAFVLTGDPSR